MGIQKQKNEKLDVLEVKCGFCKKDIDTTDILNRIVGNKIIRVCRKCFDVNVKFSPRRGAKSGKPQCTT